MAKQNLPGPWDRVHPDYRLGMKLGHANRAIANGTGPLALGWAIVGMGKREVIETGEVDFAAGAAALTAAQQYRAMEARYGPGDGIELYIYKNENAFLTSRADRDGMTLKEHTAHIRAVAREIRAMGVRVTIKEVS